MRTALTAFLFLSVIATAYSQAGESEAVPTAQEDGRQALLDVLATCRVSEPWETLDDTTDFLRRNRGASAYLTEQLKSQSFRQENKNRITSDLRELLENKDCLLDTAKRIDRERGEYYRNSLRFDVLRLFVELISEGREPFRFSAAQFNEAYFSAAEGRSQLFQVVLPPDYSPNVRYPLFVQVFGSASLLPTREDPFIRVRPSGRGVWGYRSMSRYDVMQVISRMKTAYNIDENRVYMTGTSSGATGIMHTAAYRQDVFAGLVPLVAFGNDLPLENFRNLPLRCEHGVNDWTSAIGNVRVQFQKLKTLGYDAVLNEYPTAGHGIRTPPPKTMEWLFKLKRNPVPKDILHTCEQTLRCLGRCDRGRVHCRRAEKSA